MTTKRGIYMDITAGVIIFSIFIMIGIIIEKLAGLVSSKVFKLLGIIFQDIFEFFRDILIFFKLRRDN